MEKEQSILPMLEIMRQFADILRLETEMLNKSDLKNISDVINDKSMYVHKYSNMSKIFLDSGVIPSLSEEEKNSLKEETASLLELIEKNERALENQQESHQIVINLFKKSIDKETVTTSYDKSGLKTKNKKKMPTITLNEQV